jgi:hypothetical protein
VMNIKIVGVQIQHAKVFRDFGTRGTQTPSFTSMLVTMDRAAQLWNTSLIDSALESIRTHTHDKQYHVEPL